MRLRMIAAVLVITASLPQAWAAPTTVSQQGRLLDGDGQPLQGSHDLEYSLFDSATSGTELWSESQEVPFDEGYYVVTLGSVDPLDDLLLASDAVWLQLSVDGVLLEPRFQLVSVPYALRATSAEHVDGGVVDAAELSVGGQLVVDSSGHWVGPALLVSWNDLIDVPGDLADGDADTLAGLVCSGGQVPSYQESTGLWVCSAPSGPDTLGLLSCTDGQLVTWDNPTGQWQCDDDRLLSEAEVEAFISNGVIDLAVGSRLGGAPLASTDDLTTSLPWLAITDVPGDLLDGDSDTLIDLPCADGFVAKFSVLLGAWDCAPDLDTQLGEAQVEAFVTNDAIDLAAGSSIAGLPLSTGAHTIDTDTDTQLSEGQVEGFVTNDAIDLAAGSSIAGLPLSTGAHTIDTDTDTQLSEGQVEGFVTNAPIDLAVGSSVGGLALSTGAHLTNTNLSEAQVEAYISNGPLSLSLGSSVAGVPISTGLHTINTDTQLSEGQVEAYITNAPIGLSAGTTVAGNIISTGAHTTQLPWSNITGVPGDLADGDSDTLSGLSCLSGDVAKWSAAAGAWECAVDIDTDTDTDTNTQLTETQVENYVGNGPIGLAAGTTVGGLALAGGAHTTSLPWNSISAIPGDIADGDSDTLGGLSCLGGEVARFDASVSQWLCDADAVLSEGQVESYISNAAIGLAAGSTVGGAALLSVSSSGDVGPAGSLSFASSTLYVDASAGRVGVGTSNPSRSLEVISSDGVRINNSNSGGGGYLELTNSGDNTDSWTLERDAGGGFALAHHSGFGRGGGTTTTPLFVDDLGRVGIGDTNPPYELAVQRDKNGITYLSARNDTSAAFSGAGVEVYANGAQGFMVAHSSGHSSNPDFTNKMVVGTSNSTDLSLVTNNTVAVTVDTSGKVGVGTANPGEALTVNGTIESTSGGVKFPDGTTQTSAVAGGAMGGSFYIRGDQTCPNGWSQANIDSNLFGSQPIDSCYRTDVNCLSFYVRGDQTCPSGWNQENVDSNLFGSQPVDACWRCN